MKTTINQRIAEIFEERAIKPAAIAKKFKISSTSVGNWLKGGSIKNENIEKLLEFFGDIEREWLFFGDGKKFRQTEVAGPAAVYGRCKDCLQKDALIARMQTEIDQKDVKIEELNRAIGGLMAGCVEGKREAC